MAAIKAAQLIAESGGRHSLREVAAAVGVRALGAGSRGCMPACAPCGSHGRACPAGRSWRLTAASTTSRTSSTSSRR
jgi:hypothetical protein